MSSTTASSETVLSGATPLLLPRLARAHVEALGHHDVPVRLFIAGTAGSGKTRLLRHLVSRFQSVGRPVLMLTPETVMADVADDDILLVDDAHLLDDDTLAQVATRIRTPAASILLAARPWPLSDAAQQLADELEQSQPPIVLGHVTRTDVLDQLEEDGRRLASRCADGILDLTGHLTWLVSEALTIHDDGDCNDDDAHPRLREELRDLIAHRIARIEPKLRTAVEILCLSPHTLPADELTQWALAGHAHGLLQRNGQPAPVVRDTVRATTSVERLMELYAGSATVAWDPVVRDLMSGVRDVRVATALLMDGDAALARDPRRAEELFRAAGEAGADPLVVAVRRARAEWASGRIDAAGALIDAVSIGPDSSAFPAATAIAGAVWAARGDLQMSATVQGDSSVGTPDAMTHATIAAIGVCDPGLLDRLGSVPPARAIPSTLVVSHELLARGLRATLTTDLRTCLSDLVRATEMYTAARCTAPTPELPAVLATVAALSLGELGVAHSVIETAVREGHGGAWAEPRLQLWRAWVAVQRERPHEAESALRRARTAENLAPRERVLADAITVALTRRYADSAALVPVWRSARDSILRARFDLYSLLPLGEFAMSAARLGDIDRIRPHLDEATAAIERFGSPPMWSAHLHWAGLHCAIALNQPSDLTPHARALLAAAPHSRLATMMAAAGRVWTDVLTGKVDADAIEKAALGLSSVGLAWDGARLAGQGAARSEDRRVIATLLACARQLHPREELGRTGRDEAAPQAPVVRADDLLSSREREVAALVLQGKTYAEIGEAIFISPRTAEHHIARIRRRLGATSRSDLIAKLRLALADAAEDQALPLHRRGRA